MMIRSLPTPHTDELLWSVFARAARRLRTPSHGAIARIFSGARTATAVFDLPSGLDQLCARIGSEHGSLNSEQLMARYTMLPLYAPFLWQDQLQRIKADMREEGRGAAIHLEAGIMASRVRNPAQMRHCPECDTEDFDLYGESYWRRTHQAPGVEVCPHHAVFLETSGVQRINRQTRHAYFPVPFTERSRFIKHVNLTDPDHLMLLQIARDVYWLLNENRTWGQAENLRSLYRDELAARKLAIYNGRVRLAMLNQEISRRYTEAFLTRMQCGPAADGSLRWLPQLLRSRRATQAPIYHLTLINFLGMDAQSLFTKLTDLGPFGLTGWPCLNPVCLRYKMELINHCKTGHDNKGILLGVFCCTECGYTYVRRGPDRNKSSTESIAWVTEYGWRWEEKLNCCWANEKLSLREIARRLRVDPLTVKRIAAKLGLSFPRPGKRLVHMERTRISNPANHDVHADHANCRTEWQALARQHPELSRSQLRRLSPAVYMQLYRHDRDWLMKEASPSYRAANRSSESVDNSCICNWNARDASESLRVGPFAKQMLKEPGRPKYICRTALARKLGILAWVQKHAGKLPLTIVALDKFSETREKFALRRLAYIMTTSQWSEGVPIRWRLLRLAGIRKEISLKPVIRWSIDQALNHTRANFAGDLPNKEAA